MPKRESKAHPVCVVLAGLTAGVTHASMAFNCSGGEVLFREIGNLIQRSRYVGLRVE